MPACYIFLDAGTLLPNRTTDPHAKLPFELLSRFLVAGDMRRLAKVCRAVNATCYHTNEIGVKLLKLENIGVSPGIDYEDEAPGVLEEHIYETWMVDRIHVPSLRTVFASNARDPEDFKTAMEVLKYLLLQTVDLTSLTCNIHDPVNDRVCPAVLSSVAQNVGLKRLTMRFSNLGFCLSDKTEVSLLRRLLERLKGTLINLNCFRWKLSATCTPEMLAGLFPSMPSLKNFAASYHSYNMDRPEAELAQVAHSMLPRDCPKLRHVRLPERLYNFTRSQTEISKLIEWLDGITELHTFEYMKRRTCRCIFGDGRLEKLIGCLSKKHNLRHLCIALPDDDCIPVLMDFVQKHRSIRCLRLVLPNYYHDLPGDAPKMDRERTIRRVGEKLAQMRHLDDMKFDTVLGRSCDCPDCVQLEKAAERESWSGLGTIEALSETPKTSEVSRSDEG